jgi:hypothetical protein
LSMSAFSLFHSGVDSKSDVLFRWRRGAASLAIFLYTGALQNLSVPRRSANAQKGE